MTDLYDKLKKQARDNQKRWDEIDSLLIEMKDVNKNLFESNIVRCLELLVKSLRPPINIENEINGLEKSLGDLEKVFKKMDKK